MSLHRNVSILQLKLWLNKRRQRYARRMAEWRRRQKKSPRQFFNRSMILVEGAETDDLMEDQQILSRYHLASHAGHRPVKLYQSLDLELELDLAKLADHQNSRKSRRQSIQPTLNHLMHQCHQVVARLGHSRLILTTIQIWLMIPKSSDDSWQWKLAS